MQASTVVALKIHSFDARIGLLRSVSYSDTQGKSIFNADPFLFILRTSSVQASFLSTWCVLPLAFLRRC
jgi:hypothetical protein